jgi:hypothetical protein
VSELHAGRLARNVVLTGKVLLNGKKRRLDYGLVVSYSYVPDLTKLCFTLILPYLIYACFFPPTSLISGLKGQFEFQLLIRSPCLEHKL